MEKLGAQICRCTRWGPKVMPWSGGLCCCASLSILKEPTKLLMLASWKPWPAGSVMEGGKVFSVTKYDQFYWLGYSDSGMKENVGMDTLGLPGAEVGRVGQVLVKMFVLAPIPREAKGTKHGDCGLKGGRQRGSTFQLLVDEGKKKSNACLTCLKLSSSLWQRNNFQRISTTAILASNRHSL